MNKTAILLTIAASVALSANAQKMMRITHPDGSSDLIPVHNVAKITFEDAQTSEPTDGPQLIDLGLSVKWASYNVGATRPSDYGNFYAYGEVEPKTTYTYENYLWRYPDYNDFDCDEWEKYFKLGATISGTNYDVAHVKWGQEWRMPTKEEWDELINNCNWTWTAIDGVLGSQGVSKFNGNIIFLPAAGNMVDAEHTHDQLGCFYWSATEYTTYDLTAECRNYRANLDNFNRSCAGYDYPEVGFSIRPVYGPAPSVTETVPVPTDDQMVDLGLSVKWAPFNIGSSAASGKGHFYCFGESAQKYYSHTYNYQHYDPLTDDYVDLGQSICGTEYDVATNLWGNGWRLPSKAELEELLNKCTWTATNDGWNVTGPNGNSIFLPAFGMMTYKGAPRTAYEGFYYLSGDVEEWTNWKGEYIKGNYAGFRGYRDAQTKALQKVSVGVNPREGAVQVRAVHP